MPRIERVQVGIRLEKRMIKVLKGLAEYRDMSLNDLVEDMLFHELAGRSTSLDKEHLKIVANLKKLYDMDYDDTHASFDWNEAESNDADTKNVSGAQ